MCLAERHNVNQHHTNMKRNYFFTMLAVVLLAVTGVRAQDKAAFEPAHLEGIWQLCHYVSENPEIPGTLKPSNTFKVLSDDGRIVNFTIRPGADAIIIPSKNSVSVNADAMKTSAGALHTLPVCREQNLTNTIKYLKDCGFKIVAATEKGDYDYTKANYKDPVCIIMGAEDTGVPYEHLSLCDEWIKIPLMGKIESLNVSVAAGILIYEAVKQRGFTEDKTASAL